ncbi:hypothetical protein Sjap_022806 [Stephania japonica]|uniref:Uncharacterized protein n=1 Tax=Stephania japonica TaxID=461633 RepID=A0AAP0EQ16_9MAGN
MAKIGGKIIHEDRKNLLLVHFTFILMRIHSFMVPVDMQILLLQVSPQSVAWQVWISHPLLLLIKIVGCSTLELLIILLVPYHFFLPTHQCQMCIFDSQT